MQAKRKQELTFLTKTYGKAMPPVVFGFGSTPFRSDRRRLFLYAFLIIDKKGPL